MGFPYSSGDVLTAANLNQSSGLVLVKSQTIGSNVSSVTVTNAFSSTFDNYRIIITHYSQSIAALEYRVRLGSTSTGYYFCLLSADFGGGVNNYAQANHSEWRAGSGTSSGGMSFMDLNKPYLSTVTEVNWQSGYPSATTSGGSRNGFGILNNTTSYTDFSIYPSGGTITGGSVSVYGYNNG